MRKLILIALVLMLGCCKAYCQSDSVQSKGTICFPLLIKPSYATYIVISRKKRYMIDTTYSNRNGVTIINPKWIKAIKSIQPSTGKAKYMESANNGVVIFTLNDKKYPDAFKTLKFCLIRIP